MAKILIEKLKEQAANKNKDVAESARQSVMIYEKLIELDKHIWSRTWDVLVKVCYIKNDGKSVFYYKPTKIGEIFINGLNK